MNAIEIKNLAKNYGSFSLENITFSLPRGSIMGLVGENGAGKSTIIKLLLGLVHPDGGEISILGGASGKAAKEKIGVVLDEACFPDCITVDFLNIFMRNVYKNWSTEKYYSLTDKLGLPRKKSFGKFSKGMKMKLALAAAMSHSPELLILDEPTSGLDPMIRDEIIDMLYEFAENEENSILISSHIISDLEKLCDYITFIHDGSLVFCEEKDRLLESFVLLKCTPAQYESLDEKAKLYSRKNSYSAEVLMKTGEAPEDIVKDKATLEDIIILSARGRKK